MRVTFLISLLSILLTAACVDRLSYDIDNGVNFEITIDGNISDQPGPYEVRIYNVFDIDSKETTKKPVSVRSVVISDDKGNAETLSEIDDGVYQTNPSGIRGVPGGVYKMSVELFDGRIYESLPDTILSANGSLDSLYFAFTETYNVVGEKQYNFDVFFDASYDEKVNDHILWKFIATFQAETHPELYPLPEFMYNAHSECFWLPEIGRCNYVPPCSGWRNVGGDQLPIMIKKKFDCSCCTCWYNFFNPTPILSDALLARGKVRGLKAGTVPLNQWTLEHKIRLEVSQMSLTRNTFRFWKAIRDQEKATGNLFQPISGKIPSNFVQVMGPSIPIEGLFFAASVNRKEKYVSRFELPANLTFVVSLDTPMFKDDCRKLFPNSTNHKPPFWTD